MALTDKDRELAKHVRDFKKLWREGLVRNPEEYSDMLQKNTQKQTENISGDPLDAIEQQLTKQLRIKNLMNMIREMSDHKPTQSEKKSELEIFKEFTQIQQTLDNQREKSEERLRNKILEDLSGLEDEPQSQQDKFWQTIAQQVLLNNSTSNNTQQTQNVQSGQAVSQIDLNPAATQSPFAKSGQAGGNPENQATNPPAQYSDKEMINKMPGNIKSEIQAGNLSQKQVQGAMETIKGDVLDQTEAQQLTRVFNKIKSGGNKKSQNLTSKTSQSGNSGSSQKNSSKNTQTSKQPKKSLKEDKKTKE